MPLRPNHIKPKVQALAVSVDSLLPRLCTWYRDYPDSEYKRITFNAVADRYCDLVFKFNRDFGTKYALHRPGILRIWVRNHPTDRAVVPYLHELMILAQAWHYVMPSEPMDTVVSNYTGWLLDNFGSATDVPEVL